MKWISVEDRLPENDDLVFTYPPDDHGNISYTGYYNKIGAQWITTDYDPNYGIEEVVIDVTHWMPLPPPPEGA